MLDKKYILIWLLFLMLASPLKATEIDSLRAILEKENSLSAKCAVLDEISFLFVDSTTEIAALDSALHEILHSRDTAMIYEAISSMGRFYYNNNRQESLYDLMSRTEAIASDSKEYRKLYYDIKTYISQSNLWGGKYGVAIDIALETYNKARGEQDKYGIVCSAESLGGIYKYLRKDSDAVTIYKEGFEILDKENGNTGYKMQYVGDILESLLRLKRLSECETYITRYEDLLEKWKKEGEKLNYSYPVDANICQLLVYKADHAISTGNAGEAYRYLEKADANGGAEEDPYVGYQLNFVKARYYELIKDYKKALHYVNIVLETDEYEEVLLLKAELLVHEGDMEGALAVYKRLLEVVGYKHDMTFTNQINRFYSLYDLNRQKLQSKEIELQKTKLVAKNKQLLFLSVLLILLVGMAYGFYRLYRRQLRLKKVIEQEKESLLDSEKKLRAAKEDAERANASKSLFIANISHEIRTPMNAIVGFSQLLAAEDYSKEERMLFIETIQNNSDLLLNLINDVLDLSRIESGNMKFILKEVDLKQCVQETVKSVTHRVSPGVSLLLDCPYDSFKLNTDPLRLQQLLINLLSNAAKFTEKGKIELSVQVEEEQRQVRFVVTDTGCGISPNMREKIFERFEKLDEYSQGTGLGLSICRLIADRLKGEIYLDVAYTGGARFVFIHPCSGLVVKEL